jgi:hypothetical protein
MTIEGLKFRVTGAQLRGHFEQLVASLHVEADRVEQLVIDRGIADPKAIERAKEQIINTRGLALQFQSYAQLVGEEDRLLTFDDLRLICWPIIKRSDSDIAERLTRKSPFYELLSMLSGKTAQ